MGTFIFGGVFDRFPELKLVCVEADAGWVPHYMYRMDHAYKRHRYWMKAPPLNRLPSEYFAENIYMTFQDDWVAFNMKDMCNPRRLMWANDFPHSDLHLALVAGHARRAHAGADRGRTQLDLPRQCRRALQARRGLRRRYECPSRRSRSRRM